MLWPALRVLAHGDLAADQVRQLIGVLGLDEVPRAEGPGKEASLAHRAFTDDTGARLVLDLSKAGASGWVLSLLSAAGQPSPETVESHRRRLRAAAEHLGLTIVQVDPARTADEVFLPAAPDEGAIGQSWDLPYDELDHLWPHLGVRADAPREVKKVRLEAMTRAPVWADAPDKLRRQAAEFLRD
ncbi:hypothetical protein ACIBQ1_51240 [Nonomuraea sp. NPDC050153]|uniref:hypothetical protein n=1 Tax=Nonomuraea sp. NPDC050153 TaxID=3364359 RepID=UPI0037AC74D8